MDPCVLALLLGLLNFKVMLFLSFENYLRDHIRCLLKLKIIIEFVAIFSICLLKLVFSIWFYFFKTIYPWGVPIIKCLNKFIWSKVWKYVQ